MKRAVALALPLLALVAGPGGSAQGLSASDLEAVVEGAREWLRELRDTYRPGARPLSAEERRLYAPFFPSAVLDSARIARIAGLENPDFYEIFHRRGLPDPIDFTRITGLAAIDTVLVVDSRAARSGPRWRTLLFHELVHHTQRHVLGERYIEAYVASWAERGSYRGISFESQAYELAGRFAAAPGKGFDVEHEVRALIGDPTRLEPGDG